MTVAKKIKEIWCWWKQENVSLAQGQKETCWNSLSGKRIYSLVMGFRFMFALRNIINLFKSEIFTTFNHFKFTVLKRLPNKYSFFFLSMIWGLIINNLGALKFAFRLLFNIHLLQAIFVAKRKSFLANLYCIKV